MKNFLKKSVYAAGCIVLFLSVQSCRNPVGTAQAANTTTDTAIVSDGVKTDVKVPDTIRTVARSEKDGDFIMDVIENTITVNSNIRAGIEKSNNELLKQKAQQMLTDGRSILQEMEDYARKNNYLLSIADTIGEASAINAKSERLWDRAWTDIIINDSKNVIRDYEFSQKDLSDPELKSFAAKTISILHTHLEMAEDLKKHM